MTIQYYRVSLRNEEIVIVYDTDAPNIRGQGRNECEALEDLLSNLRAIFEAIGRIQKQLCKDDIPWTPD